MSSMSDIDLILWTPGKVYTALTDTGDVRWGDANTT